MSRTLEVRDNETGLSVPVKLGESYSVSVEDLAKVYVEDGKTYLGGFINLAVATTATEPLGIAINTTVLSLHAFTRAAAGGDAVVSLYEDVTYSGGTPITLVNRNRISPVVLHPVVLTRTPAITTSGTLLAQSLIVGGRTPVFSVGGASSDEYGWFLKPNTKYVLTVNNTAAGAEPVYVGVVILNKT